MREQIVAQIVFDVAPGVKNQRARIGAHDALRHRGDDDENGVMGHVAHRAAMFDDAHGLANPPRNPHHQRRRNE
jgi:hypothetical protein